MSEHLFDNIEDFKLCLNTLISEEGLIKRTKTKSRSINSIEGYNNNSFSIPIVGEISAGHPMLADEYSSGTLNIPNKYESKNDIFSLKISGDSMIEAGIFDKDLVVIEKTLKYKKSENRNFLCL